MAGELIRNLSEKLPNKGACPRLWSRPQKTDDRQYGAAPPRPLKFAGACGIEHFKGEDVGAPGNIAAQHHADAHLALGSRDAPQQLRAMACTSMASARREAAKARLQSSKRYCPKQGKNGLSGGGEGAGKGRFTRPCLHYVR